MTRSAAKPSRRSSATARVAYSREFLERLARILVHSGHSPSKLVREFAEVCKPLKEPCQPWDPARLAFVSDLPHVIAHWHADPQYLDAQGSPLALPLRARGPSLTALVSRVLPSSTPSEVIQSLLALRAVRRQGVRYLPTDRYLAFNQQRASALAHGLTTLLGMLRTVEHNVSNGSGRRVLERASINPQFPVSALPTFHSRLKRLAAEFLWNIDRDMRRREERTRSNRTTRLGVGVFAFEDPLVTGNLRIPQSRKHRRPRPPAKTRKGVAK
jgi:hypothetical protein